MLPKTTAVWVTSFFAGLTWAQTELNQATEIDLDGLKGLGPAMTRRVLNERQKGPFQDWQDAMSRIPGMGPKKAASLSGQGLRVQSKSYSPAAPGATAAPAELEKTTAQHNK